MHVKGSQEISIPKLQGGAEKVGQYHTGIVAMEGNKEWCV
jgi:hypothetical protein